VEPAELSDIAVNRGREVFHVLPRLLPPQPSLKAKRAWKWMNKIPFMLFGLFTGV